ncbi:RNA-binding motif, single-stranded-interacting protein 3-like [Clarias magur]|uniref:RNA-binding motif, single-stranded-interacting protein 3-like n=1 Tax=Clarias magur TaxID=1594786 RepID=A0A8J4X8M9_CLAMG|nr:RNA-binding motif, single-stranded-interacting protein 3-like [Clarias magur]
MGKRLEQQPMYPQYTYYYPHYLQTKVPCSAPQFSGSVSSLSSSLSPPWNSE